MLKLDDGRILSHERSPYDPVKAREYYLRTRKLKGRKPGKGEVESTFVPKGKQTSYSVKLMNGKTAKLTPQQLAEQQAYAKQRVQAIQKKLVELNKQLKEKLAKAREAETKAKKPASAADKAEAARDAKKYRDKNQQKISNKSKSGSAKEKAKSEPSSDSVAGLKKQIGEIQKSLATAVAKQRNLSTATKNG